jgi:hypothetical protein
LLNIGSRNLHSGSETHFNQKLFLPLLLVFSQCSQQMALWTLSQPYEIQNSDKLQPWHQLNSSVFWKIQKKNTVHRTLYCIFHSLAQATRTIWHYDDEVFRLKSSTPCIFLKNKSIRRVHSETIIALNRSTLYE